MTETMPPAREIEIVRVFDAPREQVWKAWTEPEELARWWGKRGWSTPVSSITMDVRPGGAFRLNSISEADGAELPLEAAYREVAEPERLAFESDGGLATVTFAELDDGRTEMTFRTTMRATEELPRRAMAGMGSAFDRLAEQLNTTTRSHA
jgi:uncharacterized protein YndB with AHSA1/START domain